MGFAAPAFGLYKSYREKKKAKEAQAQANQRKAEAEQVMAAEVKAEEDDREARRKSLLSFNQTGALGVQGNSANTKRSTLLGN